MATNTITTPIAKFFINGQGFDTFSDNEAELFGSVDRLSYETMYLGSGQSVQKGSFVESGIQVSISCLDAAEFETLKQLLKFPVPLSIRIEFVDGKEISAQMKRTGELLAEENFARLACRFVYDSDVEVIDR